MQVHMWQLRLLRKVCMMKGVCRCNHWTIDTVTMHYGEEQFRTFLSCLHFATIIKLSNLNSIDRLQNAWSWWPSFRLSSFMAIFRQTLTWDFLFRPGLMFIGLHQGVHTSIQLIPPPKKWNVFMQIRYSVLLRLLKYYHLDIVSIIST